MILTQRHSIVQIALKPKKAYGAELSYIKTTASYNFKVSDFDDHHLYELVQSGVGGIVGDEEPHVLVGYLHRSWAVHTSHGDKITEKNNPEKNNSKTSTTA